MPTSSYLNRLVHNTRQAVTRRSRRSAEPTTTTIPPEPHTNHSPFDVFTSSNVLGMFDNDGVPIASTYRPPGVPYHYDINTEPGPSHFYNFSQPNNYIISAWTKDFTGQDVYVGHGKIEEVASDAEESANHDLASWSILAPLSLNAGDHESNELLNDERSYLSPPPCPALRKLPSLQPTPTGSDHMSFKATSVPAITTIGSSSAPIPDDSTEVNLVTSNLAMVESSMEDLQFMNTVRVKSPRTVDIRLILYLPAFSGKKC